MFNSIEFNPELYNSHQSSNSKKLSATTDEFKDINSLIFKSPGIMPTDVETGSHGAIRGGKLDGPWFFWGSNGQLLSAKNYENGVPFGIYSTYSENGLKIVNGVLMEKAIIPDANGLNRDIIKVTTNE